MFTCVGDYNIEFEKCLIWLKNELNVSSNDNNKYDNVVVITHHLPTE